MANGAARPLIFISHSHRDREAKEFVDRHLGVLRSAGNIEVWHDGEITIGDDWYQKIETKLIDCAVAVLLVSTDFLSSDFCIKEEVSRLLERRKREGLMIAPILLRPCAWKIFPWLAALQMQPKNDMPLLGLEALQQEHELTEVVLAIHGYLEERAKLVASAVQQAKATGQLTEIRGDNNTIVQVDGDNVSINIIAGPKPDTQYAALAEGAIDLTRLPTSGFDVVGRDKELRFLNEAFDGTRLNVISLRAWGGVGKSTLVNKWCEYLAADNFRGVLRVFAWSFYSQGTSERVTSADAFIDEALRFFGEGEPAQGSPWARGERLAEFVGKEKALLILDGMEPLQDEHQGIKDPALARLVECLAEKNAGLCVITTREPVKEFSDFPEATHEVDLEQLSKQAGRALLRIKGLRAADDMLEQTSAAFGNHALALILLASYLKRFASGDISQALAIPDLPDVTVEAGKHPRRVMAAFAERFGEGPEMDLLHVMGLFDRPADAGCLAALREPPVIDGLTEKLWTLDEIGWRDSVGKLQNFGLLAETSHHTQEELDAHPLVREHFGALLRDKQKETWKAGHERLYEHLKDVPEVHQPDTLAEMAPLFQAVHHGCAAGLHESSLDSIYDIRVRRGDDTAYQIRKLGAFGTDLGILSAFFDDKSWREPSSFLCKGNRLRVTVWAAYDLRSLGRFASALSTATAALELAVGLASWTDATWCAENICAINLALGNIIVAQKFAELATTYADKSESIHERVARRTALAEAYHKSGNLDASMAYFEEAEAIRKGAHPESPNLIGLWNHRYCDLLIEKGMANKALKRAIHSLSCGLQNDNSSMQHIGISLLTKGQAERAMGNPDAAMLTLDQAMEHLRRANNIENISSCLIARAAFSCETGTHEKSRRDLSEVMRLAKRCGMRLHECDAHLEYARLALAEGNPDAALPHFQSANALVDECGYHRRDGELLELKQKLRL